MALYKYVVFCATEESLTKQQEFKGFQDNIRLQKNEGLINKSISQKLSIPLKTLERYITKMRKNNLI